MPEDFYGDDAAPAEPKPGAEKESGDQQTALLPKSVLMGKKCEVGDIIKMRVTGIHENDISVACDYGPEDEAESEDNPKEEMAEAPMPRGAGGGEEGGLYA